MKIKKLIITTLLLVVTIVPLFAQQNGNLQLTLKEAKEYAIKNSPLIKNANIDLASAKQKIWETTSIGLPQVNGKLAGSYQLTVPENIKSFSSLSNLGSWMYVADQSLFDLTGNGSNFGHIAKPTPTEPASDADLKWGLTFDVTVSQLIFSGAYIVGLQTSKTFKQLSEVSITKSEYDLIESVTNAYFLCVIAQENKQVLDSIYKSTEKILYEIQETQKVGFLEETDVDQMQLTLTNIQNTRDMINRQCEVALNLLKYQMGMDLTKQIELKDKTSDLISQLNPDVVSTKKLIVENQIDYRLLSVQEQMAKLNVKLQKSTFLPDVAAYYNHQENFNKKSFSFTPPDVLGLSVNVPIFGSGQKIAKVKQANLSLLKIQNGKEQLSMGLQVQYSDSHSAFMTAMSKFQTNKTARDLSSRIYDKAIIRYKEGMISSLELSQAQNQYLQAQSNYFNTIIEMSTAYSKLEKLIK
ncbi:MAG: TolC family protein [Bacteroidetes bacterium]|nr:TolC family protein [Bacteroidota bacterium]